VLPRCIVWDFGDTLVDERWMQVAPIGCPEWPDAWRAVLSDTSFVDAWHEGRVSCDDFVGRMCARTNLGADVVVLHIAQLCSQIVFFPAVMAAVRSARSRVPQICATVNSDLFSRFVVPTYDLDRVFDAIITSWEEGCCSKVTLAVLGLERLRVSINLTETLLIDNRVDNIDEFVDAGGIGYLFTGEDNFVRDVERGVLPAWLRG
jgi:hypothetical protein